LLIPLFFTALFAQAPEATELKEKLLGTHNMRLQWVHFDNASSFGKAVFAEQNGVLTLNGELRNEKGNYVTLEGTVTAITPRNFVFEGKVVTRVDHIAEGKPCEREGKFTFRISGNRPFYRMKEMENPCDTATDYIDIYIAKIP